MEVIVPQEIELKFALPGVDGERALVLLRRHPLLRRRAMTHVRLVNRYLDTPDGWLREQRCALRLRQTQALATDGRTPTGQPRWEQTLKTAGQGEAALSVRGEWTTPLKRPRLDRAALDLTPLATLAGDAAPWDQLSVQYETRCRRTTWTLHLHGGARVEVALDVGELRAPGRRAPLLELELELLQGAPDALWLVAAALGQVLPLLPARASKAEQAQRLAAGSHHAPVRARSLELPPSAAPMVLARAALSDALGQLCDNLAAAASSDDPELIHQARVGWRRWRSVLRLVRPWLPDSPPEATALQPLLHTLGALRDWDVAATETVPTWAAAYVEDATAHPQRARTLQRALRRLRQAARVQRQTLRAQLADPATVAPLQALAAWVVQLRDDTATAPPPQWAFERLQRWHKRLARALAQPPADAAAAIEALHAARLLAKRLRYASEAAAAVLPAKAAARTQRWQRRARGWQERLGRWRDTLRAAELLAAVHAHPGLVGFLRGVAAAQHPLRGGA
ncbi:MAG: CHAD domain-containing protein [Tepidimonas ignava]|uniref:CYTH and CHAD domain-containing protein n=1 Tax=Tepidimonas ignava TaxID=114249 RepID=UPI002A2DB8AE|nr:CHAD domain-containing protein [Tepidimonas ignava]